MPIVVSRRARIAGAGATVAALATGLLVSPPALALEPTPAPSPEPVAAPVAAPVSQPATEPVTTEPPDLDADPGTVAVTVSGEPGTEPEDVRAAALAAAAAAGVPVTAAPEATGAAFVLEVPARAADAVVQHLERTRGVASAERTRGLTLFDVPNDPLEPQQQGTVGLLGLAGAWRITHGAPGVVIAVVDSGMDVTHPDLAGKVVARYDAVRGGTNVHDAVGHGTAVGSVAAARTDDGTGMAGVGWDSRLMAVKVIDARGSIADAAVANGIDWAVSHGADVINMSLGGADDSLVLRAAVARAVKAGVVVVASAGNHGTVLPMYPANLPGVISVAATQSNGQRAAFSAFGPWVDVAAPGVSVLAAQPGGGYGYVSGTSFSAPMVSGVAALVRASHPGMRGSAVVSRILSTARHGSQLGIGRGMVEAHQAVVAGAALPPVAVTSPAPGDTVGGSLPLGLAFNTHGWHYRSGDHLRVQVVGGPSFDFLQGLADTSTVAVPLWGLSGARTLRVLRCDGSVCSPTGVSVPVVVSYPAPEITSVLPAVLTGHVGLQVTGAPRTRLSAGSQPVGAPSGPTPVLNAYQLPVGTVGLRAAACDSSGHYCDGPARAGASHALEVHHLTAVPVTAPGVLPPSNLAIVRFQLGEAADVVVRLQGPAGSRTYRPGVLQPGEHTWTWHGDTTSGPATTGRYALTVATTATIGAELLQGHGETAILVDRTAPSFDVIPSSRSLFPVKDSFRDFVDVNVVGRDRAAYVVTVRSRDGGRAVFSQQLAIRPAGTLHVRWTGRTRSGRVVPAGDYGVVVTSRDASGNARTKSVHWVTVDHRRSVTRTATLTRTAAGSSNGSYFHDPSDSCSQVARFPAFGTGALRYHACSGGYVLTKHHATLPQALQYRKIRVSAYGRGVGGGSTASLYVLAPGRAEDIAVGYSSLPGSAGSHAGRTLRWTPGLLHGASLQWVVEADDGVTYDVRGFTVRVTYDVLVRDRT